MGLQDDGGYKRTHVTPKRNPPAPPREQSDNSSSHGSANAGDAPLGAFWVTQHAQGSQVADNRNPLFDEEPIKPSPSSKYNQSRVDISTTTPGDRHGHSGQVLRNTASNTVSSNGLKGGSDINLFMEPQGYVKNKASQPQSKTISAKDPFNSFVADFDANNLHSGTTATGKTSELEDEVSNLKEQLKKTTSEKAEMTAKYEKLSAICRSQRQEIQELKRTVAETTPLPSSKVSSRIPELGSQRKERIEGTVWELEQGMLSGNSSVPSSEAKTWQAFPEAKAQARPKVDHATNGRQNLIRNTNAGPSSDAWGFGTSSGSTAAAAQMNRTNAQGSSSQRLSTGAAKKVDQPSGWAGF